MGFSKIKLLSFLLIKRSRSNLIRNLQVCLLGQWLLIVWLSGCAAIDTVQQRLSQPPVNTATPMPAHPLYVLTIAGENNNHELLVVDSESWRVARRTVLLPVAPWEFSRDPQGRIWIGYGAEPGVDRRVQVFAADGHLLKTFTLCSDPYLRIHFAANRAFIPCLATGFYAAVAVIDLTTFELIKTIEINTNDNDFLLQTTGGDENYFVMVGAAQTTTNRMILLKTDSLETLSPIAIPPSNPVVILSYQDRFLIPNPVPQAITEGRPDLLIINKKKQPTFETRELPATGAFWATITENSLYVYHNPAGTLLRNDPFRALSRLDLSTGQTEVWLLPTGWDAGDIEIVAGEIILTHALAQTPEESGLYRFNPTTGQLTMLVNIPGAQRILLPVP